MKLKSFFKQEPDNLDTHNRELPEENQSEEEEDDLGIADYYLNDLEHITTGLYQVVWSESKFFEAFDMITIEKITSTGMVISCDNRKKEYSFDQLKTVQVTRDEDYDELFKRNNEF